MPDILATLCGSIGRLKQASMSLPCPMYTGDLYLKVYFPDGVENMAFNFGILAAFMVGFWLLCIIIFKVRGERYLQ